ncbi:MAG: YeeE/YedE thiosulfate transporter family protein [Gammaproteobacteria bacterium]|nr:YeeE/YedE thiosulfate transporter family protein [Gammaproteobacteria bacterium]
MGPFYLEQILSPQVAWLVYGLIGFLFGFILESAGFGDARRLAAQFYWRDITVLKVMFTAIFVAMVLVFLSTAIGWLDYDQVWVNPTYFGPGILGGLIMGFGFVIGGFCPGTSLVGASTLKLDAMWFVAGTAVGIIIFGESVSLYNDFWHWGYRGRLTVQDWLGQPVGNVILGLVVAGIAILWAGEKLRVRRRRTPDD